MSSDRRTAADAERRSTLERLPQFKRRGCNLLVTGAVSESTANRATRRLLGSPDLERRRVLVRTDDAPVADLLPAAVDSRSPTVTVIDSRDSQPAAPPAADTGPLAPLGTAVVDAADAFGGGALGCVGGEFRLSVTSLSQLLDDHGVGAVERFLQRVTAAVTRVRGLGHYRYAGPRAELSTLPVDRLFDGVVELRDRATPEHRLSLARTASTDWVEL
jgi:hypothetical protein